MFFLNYLFCYKTIYIYTCSYVFSSFRCNYTQFSIDPTFTFDFGYKLRNSFPFYTENFGTIILVHLSQYPVLTSYAIALNWKSVF